MLPSNSLVEIEIAYYPIIDFQVEETVFGFLDPDNDSKPVIEERLAQFVAKKKSDAAATTEKDYWDRKGGYHFPSRSTGKSEGSCYTTGFRLQTKKAGVYKVFLGFLTNEIDGAADDLLIRVEDKPSTRMRCVGAKHWRCYVNPCRQKRKAQ